LLTAVQSIKRWLNIPPEQAWLMASWTPAESLGLQHQLGTLERGKRASMVAIQSDFSITKTWVNGRLVFETKPVPSQEALCI
uniref:amidohydrolase family protein n=1 Tax=Vibrio anguillarum TaxID=55601 RepID=UPI00188A3057